MKNKIKIVILVAMIFLLAGCSGNENGNDNKINIVCTTFPQYDWVREIIGESEEFQLTLLVDKGTDFHSYQPTVEDITKISSSDVFIYVGGESDEWVDDVISQAVNKDIIAINMMDVIKSDLKEEDHDHEHGDLNPQAVEYDEHIWLSLKNAVNITEYIKDKLVSLDPDNSKNYKENADYYIKKLKELDIEYKEIVETSSKNTLVFGDRFPFKYMAEDYGLNYYAAFSGCSAESEASFEKIVELAEKIDEYGLTKVMIIETSDGDLAETIIENTENKDQEILKINSIQSVTAADISNGENYYSDMKENLQVLKKALE